MDQKGGVTGTGVVTVSVSFVSHPVTHLVEKKWQMGWTKGRKDTSSRRGQEGTGAAIVLRN